MSFDSQRRPDPRGRTVQQFDASPAEVLFSRYQLRVDKSTDLRAIDVFVDHVVVDVPDATPVVITLPIAAESPGHPIRVTKRSGLGSVSVQVQPGDSITSPITLTSDNTSGVVEPVDSSWVVQELAAVAPPSGGYDHVQAVASVTWLINHNLGYRPVVQAYDNLGVAIIADVTVTTTTATIQFGAPIAGYARLA